jgi:enoyl-CoA hydratase
MSELASYELQGRIARIAMDDGKVNAVMYGPEEAIGAGFLDRVVPADQLEAAALEAANDLATLDANAHVATKLRARGATLKIIRAAIESELTPENLNPGP